MRIIVVGGGKIGGTIARSLLEEKHDVLVIDTNAAVIEKLINKYDMLGVVGNGCMQDVLRQAEISTADILIAATPSDEHNIICCILAKNMGVKRTIARIHNPAYVLDNDTVSEQFGLDMTFNPELQTAEEIAHVLRLPGAKRIEKFAGGKVTMASFDVAEGNSLIGMSMMNITKNYEQKVIFGTVERGDKLYIPKGDFVLLAGDCVTVVGTESNIEAFFRQIRLVSRKIKSVSIIGGGNIGYYLAKNLLAKKISVKIAEIDPERCEKLVSELVGATVICGDGTDQTIQEDDDLFLSDACVTLTGIDEENVLLSLYAKTKGVKKVVTKVDRSAIIDMVTKMGLDSVVSPKEAISTHIIRFVRVHEGEALTDNPGEMNRLYRIHEKAEAIEFSVTEKFSQCEVPLKNIKLKSGILVGGVVRNNKFILPTGDVSLLKGDKVLILTSRTGLKNLSQILK